jgi:hypothetical protein
MKPAVPTPHPPPQSNFRGTDLDDLIARLLGFAQTFRTSAPSPDSSSQAFTVMQSRL